MELADRLRDAIERKGLSIRGFHRAMAAMEVSGSSYPVIHRYLSGTATPPLEFISAAADLLRVREAWLAFEIGPRTELDEALEDPEGSEIADRIDAQFSSAFPKGSHLSEAANAMINRVLIRAFQDVTMQPNHPTMADPSSSAISEAVAAWVASSLGGPVGFVESESPVSLEAVEDYTILQCQALLRLIPSPRERREMEYERNVRTEEEQNDG
jgi:transcriptional regulator with XRE-family HTH domain